jgi:hypothetical protein
MSPFQNTWPGRGRLYDVSIVVEFVLVEVFASRGFPVSLAKSPVAGGRGRSLAGGL